LLFASFVFLCVCFGVKAHARHVIYILVLELLTIQRPQTASSGKLGSWILPLDSDFQSC